MKLKYWVNEEWKHPTEMTDDEISKFIIYKDGIRYPITKIDFIAHIRKIETHIEHVKGN